MSFHEIVNTNGHLMQQPGTLTIYGRSCPVTHSALVLIPPSPGCDSFCLYLHADALGTEGGFLLLDHLPVRNVRGLDDLQRACVAFERDDPTADDTVGSDPVDLETSGWTFLGCEEDDSKNWHFQSFRAEIGSLEGNKFRIRVRCQLTNWSSDDKLDGEADLVAVGRIGNPPSYDASTGSWSHE